ncbi:MAG: glutamate-1-semialdehyde 2,1-aminomutase [bacterium]
MVKVATKESLFDEAKKYIPGGVNSPVRSFKGVGGEPVFVKRGRGARIYDEEGREFIDYCLSWGALILGHAPDEVTEVLVGAIRRGTSFGTATKKEIELARLIVQAIPSVEQVRLTSSGTEAVMGAVRLARAYTKKNKIIKFEGAYHGHADYLLVKAGSGAATLGIPNSKGVPEDFTKHTIVLPYNDISKVEEAVKEYKDDLAAIIVEPVAANCGVIVPEQDFLKGLRDIATRNDIVLIFDEVITGFRLSYGGAQEFFGIEADLTCLGKIIGGGLPVGAFGGRKDIMELLAPLGAVYQAGTLSGNPIAVTAGIVTLNTLKQTNSYEELALKTKNLVEGIKREAQRSNTNLKVNSIGSMFSVFFTSDEVTDYRTAAGQDSSLFAKFFHGVLKEGVYLSPSGFETNFLSTSHNENEIEQTLKAIQNVLGNLGRK